MSDPADLDDPRALRPQYHVRTVDGHRHIWDLRNLLPLARNAPVFAHPLAAITQVDSQHWGPAGMTPRAVLEHADLIAAADLRYPILLCDQDLLIDGMHRVLLALRLGHATLPARRITLPPPEHVDAVLDSLPYDPAP